MAAHWPDQLGPDFVEVNTRATRFTQANRATRSSHANSDRNKRMSRGWILETAKNPFENQPKLPVYELGKRVVVAFTLFPLRLAVGIVSCLFIWLFAFIASYGHPLEEEQGCYRHLDPAPAWKSLFVNLMLFWIRCALWSFGIWRIQVNDERSGGCCSQKELANIIVVAPHTSLLDMFVVMYLFPGSGFLGQLTGLSIPIQDRVSVACQGVFMNIKDETCRRIATDTISFRASPHKWRGPPLSVYPEGTITNGKQLIQFRSGAFAPGEPVLPVILSYPWQNYDPSWVGNNRDPSWAIRCMLQVVNYCVVDILEVYEPSEDERQNPIQYASNVRELMAEEVQLPTTEHGYDDAFFYLEALFDAHIDSDFEVYEMRQVLNADMEQLHAWLEIFKKLDTEGHGYLKRDDLGEILHLGDKHLANRIFNFFDTDGSGLIEYREFVQILAMLSGQCSKDNLAKLAFMIYDVENRGSIPRRVIADALAGYDDDIQSHPSDLSEIVVEPQAIGLLSKHGKNGKEAGNGSMTEFTVQWMWADSGLIGTKKIAEKNPFRWTNLVSLTDAIAQLMRCSAEDQRRPVRIAHSWPYGKRLETAKELASLVTDKVMEFESTEVALIHLRKLEEARFLVGTSSEAFSDGEDLISFEEFSKILEERPQLLEAIIGDLQSAARKLQPSVPPKLKLDTSWLHEGLPSPPKPTVPWATSPMVPTLSSFDHPANAEDKAQLAAVSR